ncbi:MAG: hypothetical protein KF685_04010 [Acidobacteria bacterium]|nr:hypothetical protein [Acidobacteriota bacterium]
MSVSVINIKPKIRLAGVVAVPLLLLILSFLTLKWAAGRAVALQAELPEEAEYAIGLAPGDPQTHFAAGIMRSETFGIENYDLALTHFENSAALSPHNYLIWLEVGRLRERSGEAKDGEEALRFASLLAPNYSSVQWAIGNNLLRQGRYDEGFAEIRKAVHSDPKYTAPAVGVLWNILNGNVDEIQKALGDLPQARIALISTLSSSGRHDDAVATWNSLSTEEKRSEQAESAANSLLKVLIDGKRFRDALKIVADRTDGNAIPALATVTNGGFESPINIRATSLFDWTFPDGNAPQISPTDGSRRSGNFSIVFAFGNLSDKFRSPYQTIAVEPGKRYRLEVFYRSELKTKAKLVWKVIGLGDKKVLAVSDPLKESSADWESVVMNFAVPDDTDGVQISFVREGCSGIQCAVGGLLWLDDISLTAE